MGLVHHTATVSPTKQGLVESWLPSRPWAAGRSIAGKVAEYRFDDPAGEVGVETILWTADDGSLLQVPFTYRGAPLEGAEEFLVGTMDHSVLGKRWVYDGCGDPVWAQTLTTAILTGGMQAQMVIEDGGRTVDVPARMQVQGSGSPESAVPDVTSVDAVHDDGPVTVVAAGPVAIALARIVGTPVDADQTLRGSVGEEENVVLAGVRTRQI